MCDQVDACLKSFDRGLAKERQMTFCWCLTSLIIEKDKSPVTFCLTTFHPNVALPHLHADWEEPLKSSIY